MIKIRGYAVVVIVVFLGWLMAGCSESTQPASTSSGVDASAAIAASVTSSELTLLHSAGIGIDGKGILSIGWRGMFNPQTQTVSMVGHAVAIGFDSSQSTSLRRGGVDLGSVYLNFGEAHLALQEHTMRDGSVIYNSPNDPRDGSGNVLFIPNGTYQFEISGSNRFSALTTSITAPPELIRITSPADRDSLHGAKDLTLTWKGGSTSTGVVIAIAAMPPRPDGHGVGGPPPEGGGHQGPGGGVPPPGDHPPMLDSTRAIIRKLDNNPGTYTVSSSDLQALISGTQSERFMCSVSQIISNDVEHDGGTVRIAVRNGDGVRITIW